MYQQITHTILIQASSEKIFRAITKPEALDVWFCDSSKVDPVEGGIIEVLWGKNQPRTKGFGRFTCFIPQQEVTIRWEEAPPDKYLSFRIHKNAENSCILEVNDFAPEKDALVVRQGWEQMLVAVKLFCEKKDQPF